MESLKVVICVPTYKRPISLRRLLDSIAKQSCDFTPIVLVADNEGNGGQGLLVTEQIKEVGYPWELHAIPVNERGISQVRNALMQYGFKLLNATHLAMIDDDETVDQLWIAELVAMQLSLKSDVVGGAVYPEFSQAPPRWADGLNLYWRTIHKPGSINFIQSTGNVLLSKTISLCFNNILFDPEFGMSGGGDKEFFTRLKMAGATFAFAPKAISHEYLASSRLTLDWVKQRALRIGCGDMRIMRKNKISIYRWFVEVGKSIAALAFYSVLYIVFISSEKKRVHSMLKLIRQRGKLRGIFGNVEEVYKKIHGA